jgi:hypothetical protein
MDMCGSFAIHFSTVKYSILLIYHKNWGNKPVAELLGVKVLKKFLFSTQKCSQMLKSGDRAGHPITPPQRDQTSGKNFSQNIH